MSFNLCLNYPDPFITTQLYNIMLNCSVFTSFAALHFNNFCDYYIIWCHHDLIISVSTYNIRQSTAPCIYTQARSDSPFHCNLSGMVSVRVLLQRPPCHFVSASESNLERTVSSRCARNEATVSEPAWLN
jgi:hypothetical protein